VSACPSLPIAVLAARTDAMSDPADSPIGQSAGTDLLVTLAGMPDPRKTRGVRHRLVTVLAAVVCAVLAGARSYVAIAEWAHDLPISVRVRLGIGGPSTSGGAPSESTFRRILQTVDTDELDRAVTTWLTERAAIAAAQAATTASVSALAGRTTAVRAIAVDGKTARGARRADGRAVHLLAALDQTSGIVLGQSEIDGKTNEITGFAPLLDRIDITNALIRTSCRSSWSSSVVNAAISLPFVSTCACPSTAPLVWSTTDTRCGAATGPSASRVPAPRMVLPSRASTRRCSRSGMPTGAGYPALCRRGRPARRG